MERSSDWEISVPLHCSCFILLSLPCNEKLSAPYFNACQLPPLHQISSNKQHPGSTCPLCVPHSKDPPHYVWPQHPIENWVSAVTCHDNELFVSQFEKAFKTLVFISNYRKLHSEVSFLIAQLKSLRNGAINFLKPYRKQSMMSALALGSICRYLSLAACEGEKWVIFQTQCLDVS